MTERRPIERFGASYAVVDRALNSPLKDAVINGIRVSAHIDSSAMKNATSIPSKWSMFLSISGRAGLKLQMAPHPSGSADDGQPTIPAILTLTEVPSLQFLLDSSILVKISMSKTSPFTVKKFLQFLKSDGLLHYEISPETHPGFWTCEVAARLGKKCITSGGSSLKISRQVEAYNKRFADDWHAAALRRDPNQTPRRPPQVDTEIVSKPGAFVKIGRVRQRIEASKMQAVAPKADEDEWMILQRRDVIEWPEPEQS